MFIHFHEPHENDTGRPIRPLSTHKGGDGTISVRERSSAAKSMASHIGKVLCQIWCSVNWYSDRRGNDPRVLEPTETEVNIQE